jgi:hypothetical protein
LPRVVNAQTTYRLAEIDISNSTVIPSVTGLDDAGDVAVTVETANPDREG